MLAEIVIKTLADKIIDLEEQLAAAQTGLDQALSVADRLAQLVDAETLFYGDHVLYDDYMALPERNNNA